MEVFKFIKKQLNFSKKWTVGVDTEGDVMTSEALQALLMCKHGYKRKDVSEMTDNIKNEIMEALLNGNTVDVFGLVKIKPDFCLKNKFVGNENDASLITTKLSVKDVKTKLKVNINQTFNHKFIKLFTSGK